MTAEPTCDPPAVLYVDPEAENRAAFASCFGRQLRVQVAASAAEALALLERERVAVLVSDQRVAGAADDDLLEEARRHHPDVIRFVITAYSDPAALMRALEAGLVARYFVKPWDLEALGDALAWAVDAHRLTRENAALQSRLAESERLATLGIIGAGMLHDLKQPLAYSVNNGQRLQQLVTHAIPAVERLLRGQGELLGGPERRFVADLVDELPDVFARSFAALGLGDRLRIVQSESQALELALDEARPGDLVLMTLHLDRLAVGEILCRRGP